MMILIIFIALAVSILKVLFKATTIADLAATGLVLSLIAWSPPFILISILLLVLFAPDSKPKPKKKARKPMVIDSKTYFEKWAKSVGLLT